MPRLSLATAIGFLMLSMTLPAAAQVGRSGAAAKAPAGVPSPLPGNALAGKLKSEEERCQECHGHDGYADAIEDGVGNIGKYPRLAGQHVDYITKQFREFRSGQRDNDIMPIMAKTVSDADLADIAAYFASLKPMQGEGKGDNPVGRQLYQNGDPARGIPACVGCHGEQRQEGGPPRIAGQHRRYLHKQLGEWRGGYRKNSPGGVMNAVAKGLTDAEIDALADYIAGR